MPRTIRLSVSPPATRSCGAAAHQATGVTFTTYNARATCPVVWWFGRGTLCHRHKRRPHTIRSFPTACSRGQRHPYSYRGSDGAHPMILKQLRDDTRGAALVEFTVTIPFFLLLTFGLIQAGLLLWTQAGLQHGVEVAARCASVNYSANQMGLTHKLLWRGTNDRPSPIDTIKQYAVDNSCGLVPSISHVYRNPNPANIPVPARRISAMWSPRAPRTI